MMSVHQKKEIMSVKDIKSTVPDVPLDYSFMNLTQLDDILSEDPVSGHKMTDIEDAKVRQENMKRPVSIRLSNNNLSALNNFSSILSKVFLKPDMLQWVDISGNALKQIPAATFDTCPYIITLHVHSNELAKLSDIDAVAKLTKLRSLTMHGNPVEEKKHYRNYVIYTIPSLIQLDFSPITKDDREKAAAWSLVYRKKLQQRTVIKTAHIDTSVVS